jgi:hypothetical protein
MPVPQSPCLSCAYEARTGIQVDTSKSKAGWARELGVDPKSIARHLNHPPDPDVDPIGNPESTEYDSAGLVSNVRRMADDPWGRTEWDKYLLEHGTDPETVTYTHGVTSDPHSGRYWNKLNNVRPIASSDAGGPAWPVIQQAAPVVINVSSIPTAPARDGLLLSMKSADPQIGFRALPDGTFEAFHDWDAMMLFAEACRQEQPESIVILGDFLDLAAQGKYTQEAGFARTTQAAFNEAHRWLAILRAFCPDALIVIIEGNHDKRMQNYVEANALSAFGLTRANMPEEWPVMSLPFLLRLSELGIEYVDAYPAATHWDDDQTRNIHGTRANSKGSTMSQYSNDLPHINTWAGHTHRTEIVYKTVMGARGVPIESYSANPGCLCKTNGMVPSVHGALHADGTSAPVVEDWQQGFGSLLYDGKGQSWPQVHRIRDGRAIYNGRVILPAAA